MARKLNKTWIALGFLVLLLVDTYARPSVESQSESEEDDVDDADDEELDEDYEFVTYSSDTNFLKILRNTILYLDQFVQKFIKPHLEPTLPAGHKPGWVATPTKKPEQGSKPATTTKPTTPSKPADKTTQKPVQTTSKPAPKPVQEPTTTTTTTTPIPTTIPTTTPTTTPVPPPITETPKPVEVVEVAPVEAVKPSVDPLEAKPADSPVEIPLDPVDVGENLVDTPLANPIEAEKPSAKSTEKPNDKPTEHPLEKSTAKPEKEKPVLTCHNCTIQVTCPDCVQFRPELVVTDPTILPGRFTSTTPKPSASMKFLIPDMLEEELERNEADMMYDTTGSPVVPDAGVSITENAMPEADVIPMPETLPAGEPAASPVDDMSQQPAIPVTADKPVAVEASPVLPSATPTESVTPSAEAVPSSAKMEVAVPSESVAPLGDGTQVAAKPELAEPVLASADPTAVDSAIPPESVAPSGDAIPEALSVAMPEAVVEPVLPAEPTVPSEVVAASGVQTPETMIPAAMETEAM